MPFSLRSQNCTFSARFNDVLKFKLFFVKLFFEVRYCGSFGIFYPNHPLIWQLFVLALFHVGWFVSS